MKLEPGKITIVGNKAYYRRVGTNEIPTTLKSQKRSIKKIVNNYKVINKVPRKSFVGDDE
ncbi:MAG: hypothetical protein IJ809_05440 [Clostridia bacterium]|nr:hypothetical protein [Clostridia bacterium]